MANIVLWNTRCTCNAGMRRHNRHIVGQGWESIDHQHSLAGGSVLPKVHLAQHSHAQELKISLPGIKENRFEVEIIGPVLLVNYWLNDGENRKKLFLGAALPLMTQVNTSAIDAHFEAGELRIKLPYYGYPSPLDGSFIISMN